MSVTCDTVSSSPTDLGASSRSPSVTPPSLSEPERTTWRLILHTLSVRRCVAFVREEEGRWMVVEAHITSSPAAQEDSIRLSRRYLTASEAQALPFVENRMGVEELTESGVGSGQLTVPLLSANHTYGFLRASERIVNLPFSEHDRVTLLLLGCLVLSSLRSILRASEDDHSPAHIDYLTSLYNYRYFCQRLKGEILQAELLDRPLSLLMIDLDQYKQVNDTYGHEIGNMVLAQIAPRLRLAVRKTDVVCRYGGDEFAVLLPHAGKEEALTVARRLEEALRASQVDIPGVEPIFVPGLSIGLSTFPSPASSGEELIRQADRALYVARGHPLHSPQGFDEDNPSPATC